MKRQVPAALVFDCDGVLLDSNRLKTDAFAAVLLEHGYSPRHVEDFVALQRRSFGLSRYRLFDMFFTDVLGTDVDAQARQSLLESFAQRCRTGYLECQPTAGAIELLSAAHGSLPLFVASGSDEAELREVFAERGFAGYFNGIYGSPRPKKDSLKEILAQVNPASHEDVWFFGDAKADWDAASSNGVTFFYVAAYSSDQANMATLAAAHGFSVLDTLADLPSFTNTELQENQ